jgi:hypothetical protein
VGAQKSGRMGQRGLAFIEKVREGLKDVRSSRGHFELDGDVGGCSGRGQTRRVVQQHLVRPGLDQQRRDSAQIGNNGLNAEESAAPA